VAGLHCDEGSIAPSVRTQGAAGRLWFPGPQAGTQALHAPGGAQSQVPSGQDCENVGAGVVQLLIFGAGKPRKFWQVTGLVWVPVTHIPIQAPQAPAFQ
jgi:hypothetical protein